MSPCWAVCGSGGGVDAGEGGEAVLVLVLVLREGVHVVVVHSDGNAACGLDSVKARRMVFLF